jgi:hypothetical protein
MRSTAMLHSGHATTLACRRREGCEPLPLRRTFRGIRWPERRGPSHSPACACRWDEQGGSQPPSSHRVSGVRGQPRADATLTGTNQFSKLPMRGAGGPRQAPYVWRRAAWSRSIEPVRTRPWAGSSMVSAWTGFWRRTGPGSHPQDVDGEPALGLPAHRRGARQAGHSRRAVDVREIQGPAEEAAIADGNEVLHVAFEEGPPGRDGELPPSGPPTRSPRRSPGRRCRATCSGIATVRTAWPSKRESRAWASNKCSPHLAVPGRTRSSSG